MLRYTLLAMLFCQGAHAASSIVVGSLTLTPCIKFYNGYCGSIVQPLDRNGFLPGKVTVGFEFYPHTDTSQPPLEPILAQEGGPGYSTTGSRDGYVRLLDPLRDRHDIILIDKRGTGRSSPIDCHALQHAYLPDQQQIKSCGDQLGQAAWKYRSADAADDVAAILAALDFSEADYYGDSYATWFGQVLAVLHPNLLRSMVFDSAYPVVGDNSNSEVNHGQRAMDLVCERSAPCKTLGSSATARFAALLDSLRAKPANGMAPGAAGEPRMVRADPRGMFLVIANAGNTPTTWRDLDAAGRAWMDDHDALPLLRLVAEARDSYAGNTYGYHEFSVGLAQSVICAEYGANFNQYATLPERRQEYQTSIARMEANHPNAYAPFTFEDALYSQMNAEEYNTCLTWPIPAKGVRPGQPIPPNSVFPAIPVLVLSGELDTITSPDEGRTTYRLFPNATFIKTTNLIHESAVGDGGVFVPPNGQDLAECIGPIVRNFISTGGQTGDTSCVRQIRPIRTVPAFARRFSQVLPATPTQGNQVDKTGLKLASAVAETVGDALARYYITNTGTEAGLRGGSFSLKHTHVGYILTLDKMQWVDDVVVTGQLDWNQLSGDIAASVSFIAPSHAGAVQLSWNERQTEAVATLSGAIDGATLNAQRLAP